MLFIALILKIIIPVAITPIGIGLFCTIFSLQGIWNSNRAKRWQATQGKLLNSTIKEQDFGRHKRYPIAVSYEYSIDGTRYQSARVFFGQRYSPRFTGITRLEAQKKSLIYRSGSPVTVYYNPKKPKEAVLEPEIQGFLHWMLAVGSVFLLFGFFIGTVTVSDAINRCGITPSSTDIKPDSPVWCKKL